MLCILHTNIPKHNVFEKSASAREEVKVAGAVPRRNRRVQLGPNIKWPEHVVLRERVLFCCRLPGKGKRERKRKGKRGREFSNCTVCVRGVNMLAKQADEQAGSIRKDGSNSSGCHGETVLPHSTSGCPANRNAIEYEESPV